MITEPGVMAEVKTFVFGVVTPCECALNVLAALR